MFLIISLVLLFILLFIPFLFLIIPLLVRPFNCIAARSGRRNTVQGK